MAIAKERQMLALYHGDFEFRRLRVKLPAAALYLRPPGVDNVFQSKEAGFTFHMLKPVNPHVQGKRLAGLLRTRFSQRRSLQNMFSPDVKA